jgi:hypothetical protein
MFTEASTSRGDRHLGLILHETANWTVNGRQDVVFCEVASLRLALDKAAELTAEGREVVALVRKRPAEIVVSLGQLRQLTGRLCASGIYPVVAEANKA